MDGTPYDQRTPPSPPSRKSSTHFWDRYSGYQSGIVGDLDSSDDERSHRKSRRSGNDLFDTDDESSTNGGRRHRRGKPDVQKKTRFQEPVSRTHIYPQGTKASRSDGHVNSSTTPQVHANSSRRPIPAPQQQQNSNSNITTVG